MNRIELDHLNYDYLVDDLVSESIFEEKRSEKQSKEKLSDMKSVSMSLGSKAAESVGRFLTPYFELWILVRGGPSHEPAYFGSARAWLGRAGFGYSFLI